MAEALTYTTIDRVSTVTMDDGKVNVFSIPMLRSLHEAFDRAEQDGTVVLLKGRPGCFTAGFDHHARRTTCGRRHHPQAGRVPGRADPLLPRSGGGGVHRARVPRGRIPPNGGRRPHRDRRAVPVGAQ